MGRICWHDRRLGLGALLTLLAWGAASPQARAGCERPTIVLWPTAGASLQVEVGSSSNALPIPMSHNSMPGRQPCSGPNCLRAPLAPPTPPVTTISPSQESACLVAIPGGADRQGMVYRLEDDPHTPIFRTFRIYHPPR